MNPESSRTTVASLIARGFAPCVALGLWAVAGPVLAQGTAAAPASATAPLRVTVAQFQVNGNTLLPAGQIDAALAPFKGERTLDELKAAAAAVQELYRRAGYGAVVALLPEQALSSGTVQITVVEGKMAKVSVAGQQQFSEANVRASLPDLATGRTPQVRRIDSQIQMANENPAKRTEVLLQPGALPGEVEAKVTVTETPVMTGAVRLDNTGNQRTGRSRLSLSGQHANLTGRDDVLSAEFQTGPEQPKDVLVLSTGYRVPLYALRTAIDAYLVLSDIDGGNTTTVAGDLQFAGRGQVAGVRASHYLPRWGELDQRASLGFEHRNYLNDCRIAGLPPGACGPAGESVSVQPLTLGYSLQGGGERPFSLNVSLHRNLLLRWGHGGNSDFEAVRPGAKPRYTVLRSNAAIGLALPEEWQMQARLGAQWTDDGLVSGEQFGLGGASSIRGYEERELGGDIGVSASFELVTPELAPAANMASGSLRLLAFADVGWIKNRLDTPCRGIRNECSLSSLGLGGRFAWGPMSLRLDVAHPLRSATETDRGDTHAHVSFNYAF